MYSLLDSTRENREFASICKDTCWIPRRVSSKPFPLRSPFLPSAIIYKAIAIRPATAAARPTSSLPAAPVDSATPPVDVPVAAPVGLGAEPDAVARVALPEGETITEPVPDADAEAPVPLGLTLPVEVGTSVAINTLAFTLDTVHSLSLPSIQLYAQTLTP